MKLIINEYDEVYDNKLYVDIKVAFFFKCVKHLRFVQYYFPTTILFKKNNFKNIQIINNASF